MLFFYYQKYLYSYLYHKLDRTLFTYELNIVELLVLELFQSIHGVSVQRKGNALEGLMFGVNADVSLHLRTVCT